jgi:hypothetical protein
VNRVRSVPQTTGLWPAGIELAPPDLHQPPLRHRTPQPSLHPTDAPAAVTATHPHARHRESCLPTLPQLPSCPPPPSSRTHTRTLHRHTTLTNRTADTPTDPPPLLSTPTTFSLHPATTRHPPRQPLHRPPRTLASPIEHQPPPTHHSPHHSDSPPCQTTHHPLSAPGSASPPIANRD